jgi:prevent-host-death family protein
MDSVGAYEAKTHLAQLLKRVARGETITITRHGVPVAVLAPPRGVVSPQQAVRELQRYRKRFAARSLTEAEIRAWKHEGHRY